MRDHSRPKKLDEMDDLRDMGRFPVAVYMGATGNILFAILLTYLVHARYAQAWAMLAWAAGLAAGNAGANHNDACFGLHQLLAEKFCAGAVCNLVALLRYARFYCRRVAGAACL